MAHQPMLIFQRPTMAEAALYARRPSDDGAMLRRRIVEAGNRTRVSNSKSVGNFEQKVSNINASSQ